MMPRRWRDALLACALVIGLSSSSTTLANDYGLVPRQVAPDTWVIVGLREDFSRSNGGNIVNTAFVVTGDGVVVIDSGPTRLYGEALRAAIAKVSNQAIREVWNTHHHPDHVLGNQAFADRPILALEASRQGLAAEGEAFVANVYRMTGDWAKGTELLLPKATLQPGEQKIGRHAFRLMQLEGHTAGDLAVFDSTTGVLFAGDLVFNDRAPTTPHANVAAWLRSLDALATLPMTTLIPGHGNPSSGQQILQPIAQTRHWLTWLDGLLREAARQGLDPGEIVTRRLPPEFSAMPLARQELIRSVAHLYRQVEAETLR